MSKGLGRPSPAMVVASIALFVALGGTGYAAATGSIDSREIKNSSIQGKDVKNSSLGGADVKNSALTGSDVKNNSLTGSDVNESNLGKVPSSSAADTATKADTANSATNATSAGNANTVAGSSIRKFSLTAPGPMFTLGGLTLSCAGTTVVATASEAGRITAVGVDSITANDTDNRTSDALIAAGASRVITGAAPANDPDPTSQAMSVSWTTSDGASSVTSQFRSTSCSRVHGTAVGG